MDGTLGNNDNGKILKFQFWSDYDYLEKLKSVPEPSIFNGWIVEGGKNIIYGAGGTGKSILAFANALEILKKNDDYFVFYIDYDNPVVLPKARGFLNILEEYKDRFFYINQAHIDDILNSDIANKLNLKRIKNRLKQILKFIYHTAPDGKVLVVIDSLQRFVDITEQSEVANAFDFMDMTGFTYLILHHQNKLKEFKGLTYIRDSVDSFYEVKGIERDGSGVIKLHSIIADKRRFLTEQEVTFKYDFLEISDIVCGAGIEKDESIVLRIAVSILRKEDNLTQSKLVEKIKEKLSGIGEKKIRHILKLYADKGLFTERTGVHNSKYYEVNEDSPYISILFNDDLSEEKRRLLDTLKEVGEIPEIEITDRAGSVIVFKTKEAIKKSIFRLEDYQVKQILEKIEIFIEENEAIEL